MTPARAALLTSPILLLAALAPASAHAQDELRRPDAWKVRPDDAAASGRDVYFVDMPPGWHVTTGPAVILWDPATTVSGRFEAEAEVFLFDPRERREGFGVFVAGRDLEGPDLRYLYFLVREGGEFLVKRRSGERTEVVKDWTAHPSVASWASRTEGEMTVRNVLRVEARRDRVRFLVNGDEVASLPRAEAGLLDGVVGLRVNHGLNLHVSRLEVRQR